MLDLCFPQEKRLLEILLEFPIGYLANKTIWDTNGSNILVDGEKLRFNKGELMCKDPSLIRSALMEAGSHSDDYTAHFTRDVEAFVSSNSSRLNEIELEAFDIINRARNMYKTSSSLCLL